MNMPQEVFDEIKEAAIKQWNTFDNTHGYVDEKLTRVNSIRNIQLDGLILLRMFHRNSRQKIINSLSDRTKMYLEIYKNDL